MNAYDNPVANTFGSDPKMDFLPNGKNANPYWNGLDFLLPGSSILNSLFDPTGSNAAKAQFTNQQILDQQARDFNASEAEKQRAWEEYMSSSAIQRQVSDAKAAGINPIALFGNGASGAGADTPSGSSAASSGGNASIANNKLAAAAGVVAMFLRFVLTKH